MREDIRANKKFTIIKVPKPEPEKIEYLRCKVHKAVRMVDVQGTLRCSLCGCNIPDDSKVNFSGVI